MIKKYIKNYPDGGSWDIEKPEWYGKLQSIVNCRLNKAFTFVTNGNNCGQLLSGDGGRCGFYLFEDLHEFGSTLDGGGIGDTYTLEVVEMDEKEFQPLPEFMGY